VAILFTHWNSGDRQPWHHMYRFPSSSSPSLRTWDQLNGTTLLATSHTTKLNELTESEVTELTSSKVDEKALAILKTQRRQGITIVSLQSQIIFDVKVIPY